MYIYGDTGNHCRKKEGNRRGINGQKKGTDKELIISKKKKKKISTKISIYVSHMGRLVIKRNEL